MRGVEDGTKAARVTIDERGRFPGRGAYLCAEQACWDRALGGRVLERALRGAVTEADRDRLRAFAVQRFATETMTEEAR